MPEPQSVDEQLAAINAELEQVNARVVAGEPLQQIVNVPVVDYYGKPITGPDGQPMTEQKVVFTELGIRAHDLLKARDSIQAPAGISPNVQAQVGAQQAQTAESARQFDISSVESQRKTNLTAALDLLEQQVKMGELQADEATSRVTAAVRQADAQNESLKNFAPYGVAPGQPFFPNAGPTGPLAEAIRALGLPFGGFETGGTMPINPNFAAIPGALGGSAVPGVSNAIQQAAGSLAGMGVVPPTPAGRQQRPPSQGVSNAALALAGG